MKKIICTAILLATSCFYAQEGKVGIGTTEPKATLDVTGTPASTTTADGIIAPRLTGDQLAAKDAVYLADQTGAQVYVTAAATTPAGKTVNVTAPGYYYFDGAAWQKVGSGKFVDGSNPSDAVYTDGNVGIGTTTPNASAALDVTSTTRGFLPPRMTNEQMKAIVNPVNGLTVYNTTLNCLAYYVDGSYNCTHNQPAQPAPTDPLGSTYTAHFNGITAGVSADHTLATYATGETFDQNADCATAMISAQGCGGLTQVTGASGTVYPLVNINGQCWMQTNLKEVPSNFASYTPTSWLSTNQGDQGYWGYYNRATTNGTAGWGTSEPAANEGLLYQWSAAMDNSVSERSRGVCPVGFHLPSDCEWKYLEHGQGMAISEQNSLNPNPWRSNTTNSQGTPGYKLRSQGTGQTNASGFSGLLAGYRNTNGTFSSRAFYGNWWSSSATGATTAIYRSLYPGDRGVSRVSIVKAFGFSVRCLKD
jgi:uncharacterized protein (TIGR02145 family)